ncbi:hypothetical protein Airi02_065430 [Actinoallomurus iriomotensis]|uniref:Uncharacterized protein n=1 Tax=Actinoallomurus iriomotensis TaxID=478107 RepID=A0A9W6W2N1_9ACTN|nr:hypothetical protein Airi02_065430 [Actinoallomurus iriomotensis]
MSRKSPGSLRARQYPKRPESVPVIDGLPAKVLRQITDVSRAGRCGTVAEMATALGALRWFLVRPGRVLIPDPVTTCPCHDPREALDVLNEIMDALPGPAARHVAAIVEPLSEQYRARTLPNPYAPPNSPWWWRRISEL